MIILMLMFLPLVPCYPESAPAPANQVFGVREDVAKALGERDPGIVCLVWPKAGELVKQPAEIKEEVRKDAAAWLAKVLKPEYLDANLAARFVGARKKLPANAGGIQLDCLLARYEKAGIAVLVSESMANVCVMLEPREAKVPQDMDAAERLADETFRAAFIQPDARKMRSKYMFASSKQVGVRTVYFGEFGWNADEKAQLGPETERWWYNQVIFFVDNASVGFMFPRSAGEKFRPVSGSLTRW